MMSWILVIAIGGLGGLDLNLHPNLTREQCVAMANAFVVPGQIIATCFGPDGSMIDGQAADE